MAKDNNVILIYRCFQCDLKRVFYPSERPGANMENDEDVLKYIEFDKAHIGHKGWILIEKLYSKNTEESALVIDKIITEISEFKK